MIRPKVIAKRLAKLGMPVVADSDGWVIDPHSSIPLYMTIYDGGGRARRLTMTVEIPCDSMIELAEGDREAFSEDYPAYVAEGTDHTLRLWGFEDFGNETPSLSEVQFALSRLTAMACSVEYATALVAYLLRDRAARAGKTP